MPQEPNVFKDYVPGRLLILPSFELVLTVVAAVVLVAVVAVVVVVLTAVVVVEQALLWPAPDSPAIKVLHLKANIKLETRVHVSCKIICSLIFNGHVILSKLLSLFHLPEPKKKVSLG